MISLLYEARIVAHRIFLTVGALYLLSAVLLLSPISAGFKSLLSFIHVFTFFPTLLFLGINATLFFLTMKDVKSTAMTSLPTKNIIAGSIAGVISAVLIIWLLLF
ncbi:MAG: hypothetical protein ACK4NC_02835 [Candidatus Gracilibacteria bacterium]